MADLVYKTFGEGFLPFPQIGGFETFIRYNMERKPDIKTSKNEINDRNVRPVATGPKKSRMFDPEKQTHPLVRDLQNSRVSVSSIFNHQPYEQSPSSTASDNAIHHTSFSPSDISQPPFQQTSTTDVLSKKSSRLQVPLTLFPDMDPNERPREEDPNIMPIPRELGFKFDPRHLRDLDTIERGGNGCAKPGWEFEIEQDYELGVTGAMGTLQPPRKRQVIKPTENKKENEWQPGKGDEEGLLKELPGFIDTDDEDGSEGENKDVHDWK